MSMDPGPRAVQGSPSREVAVSLHPGERGIMAQSILNAEDGVGRRGAPGEPGLTVNEHRPGTTRPGDRIVDLIEQSIREDITIEERSAPDIRQQPVGPLPGRAPGGWPRITV